MFAIPKTAQMHLPTETNDEKNHIIVAEKKQAAQIHALIKRTYIFQKVGISVLNRINSDILQFIFIVHVSFFGAFVSVRERASLRRFLFWGCKTQFYLFLSVVMCFVFFSLVSFFLLMYGFSVYLAIVCLMHVYTLRDNHNFSVR